MNAWPAFMRLASRFSLRVSFGALFAFPPRGALPAILFTLPFFSWRDSDDHSPFDDAKHFSTDGSRSGSPVSTTTCLFWGAGYGEGMPMTVLFDTTERPADATVVASVMEIAGSRHEVLPPRMIGAGVDVLFRSARRAPPP